MDALTAARTLLPAWVGATLWLLPLGFGATGYLVTRLVLARALPALPAEPWTERARLLFPARQLAQRSRLLHLSGAIVLSAATLSAWATPWTAPRLLLTLAAAWAGPLLASLQLEGRLRGLALPVLVRSWLTLAVVLFGALYVIAGFSALRSATQGPLQWAVSAAGFCAAVFVGTGGSSMLGALLGVVRPARPRVRAAVERAAARLGVRCRAVLELDWAQANALAFPLLRRVAFSTAAVELLDDAELEAVAAHELGHLDEPLPLRAFRPLVLVLLAFVVFVEPYLVTASLWSAAATLVGVLLVILVVRRVARRGEQHADAYAKDDGAYARALEKISRQNLLPLVLRRPGPHGDMWDRLVAAGRTFEVPKPAPPARPPRLASLVLLAAVAGPLTAGTLVALDEGDTPADARRRLALGDPSPWTLEVLARDAATAGRHGEAVTLYRAARQLSPDEPVFSAALARSLGDAGQCSQGRAELAELERLLVASPGLVTPEVVESAAWSVEQCERNHSR